MHINGIFSHVHTHSFRTTVPGKRISIPDRVERRFAVDEPNKVWWTDITYIWTNEGWLYLSALEDGYSRKVVGYAFADHLKTTLPLKALQRALKERKPQRGLIHHSDRGTQYTSGVYQTALVNHGICPSMGRTGVCWDNAAAESFWATLKKEVIYRQRWRTRRQAKGAITIYIARCNGGGCPVAC
jgi:transposase InsO family protein